MDYRILIWVWPIVLLSLPKTVGGACVIFRLLVTTANSRLNGFSATIIIVAPPRRYIPLLLLLLLVLYGGLAIAGNCALVFYCCSSRWIHNMQMPTTRDMELGDRFGSTQRTTATADDTALLIIIMCILST